MSQPSAPEPSVEGPYTADEVAVLAQVACVLEVSAPKPGNVAPGIAFRDVGYEDFLLSAAAIALPFAGIDARPLGATIRLAVERTARWTVANTNLGIILLLAPLARAACRETPPGGLRARVAAVLAETTVGDAREVYAAIRRARPGGLGRASAQDVDSDPTVTLHEAMALAADRDVVAREYTTDFGVTFETGLPLIERARRDGLSWPDTVVETYIGLLASSPDTLIARKLGATEAEAISRRARSITTAGGVRTAPGRKALEIFGRDLRDEHNVRNPGATADLTAAASFVYLLRRGRP